MQLCDPIKLRPALLIVAVFAVCACSNETDEAASMAADVGADVEQPIPSVETIEFEGSTPGTVPRVHVESARSRGVISATPLLAAESYLSREMASRLITGTDLDATPIAGQTASESHNSVRYAPVGTGDQIFGVSLQIWDLSEKQITASERLSELREQYLNVAEADFTDAPEGSFTSHRAGIRSFVFTGDSSPSLFVLSCDVDHCHNWDDLYELGSEIASAH